jgi:hypothetical protein
MIFLGVRGAARLRRRVSFAEIVTQTWYADLSGYPPWLLVLGGSFALALLIWIVMKLMKLALWLAFFGVLIGGIAWAGWLLLN